jgi:ribonuclease P protein component
MVRPTDERFPKSLRIRKRAEYLEIQSGGTAVHGRLFVGLVRVVAGRPGARLGITTAKKVGNAVTRNRTRRLVREAFRRNRALLPDGMDIVVVAKRTAAGCGAAAIAEDLAEIGRRASRIAEARRC